MPQTDFEQFRKERIQEEREAKQQVIQELAVLRAENAKLRGAIEYALEAIKAVASFGKTKPVIARISAALDSTAPDPLYTAAPELLEALQSLYDEQNGCPLERRREQWEAAIKKTQAVLFAANGGTLLSKTA